MCLSSVNVSLDASPARGSKVVKVEQATVATRTVRSDHCTGRVLEISAKKKATPNNNNCQEFDPKGSRTLVAGGGQILLVHMHVLGNSPPYLC
jgi:hypothetical protein